MSARSDIQTAMAALARQEVTAVSVAVRVSDYGLALTAEREGCLPLYVEPEPDPESKSGRGLVAAAYIGEDDTGVWLESAADAREVVATWLTL